MWIESCLHNRLPHSLINNTVSIIIDDADFANVIGRRGMNARLIRELVDFELDIQKLTDYQKRSTIIRRELSESEDPILDAPLSETIDNISSLVLENLIGEGYDTPRKILLADPAEIATKSGISLELIDDIMEKIIQKRK